MQEYIQLYILIKGIHFCEGIQISMGEDIFPQVITVGDVID